MKPDFLITVQTREDLVPWEVGKKILSMLFSETKLIPERVATFGEVTKSHGLNIVDIEDCRALWASKAMMRAGGSQYEVIEDFHWKRDKVAKSQGAVTFTSINAKGVKRPGSIFFQSQYRREIDWILLFLAWCETVSPFAAVLHPFIAEDGPRKGNTNIREYSYKEEISHQAWSRFLSGEFHCEFRAGEMNSLVSGLTNLGWASWFGEEYAKEVDQQAISSAGFPVFKIGCGYLVQLTSHPNDVIGDYPAFSRLRAHLKSLFRPGLFLIEDEP
ncbi:hypothetical protein ACXHXG_24605 [Rhizobium sp. LEGMi198b]